MGLYLPTFSETLAVSQTRGADSDAPGLWDELIGDWPIPESGGATVFDVSGHGNHATLTNMDPGTDRVTAAWGRAVDVQYSGGASEHIMVGAAGFTRAAGEPFSVWTLVHPDTTFAYSGQHRRWCANGRLAGGWLVTLYYGSWYFLYDNGGNGGLAFASAPGTIPTSVVGVYDGSDIILYLDGTEAARTTGKTTAQITDDDFDLVGAYCDGRKGPTAIYNRGLAPSEVQQLYVDPWAMHRLRRRVYKAAAAAGGAMSGSTSVGISASGTAAGEGFLVGSAACTLAASGVGAGTGSLAGTAACSVTASGVAGGAGALSGSAALAVDCSGTIVSPGAISGSVSIALSVAATAKGTGQAAATGTVGIAATGTPQGRGKLAGAVALAITAAITRGVTGQLRGAVRLSARFDKTRIQFEPAFQAAQSFAEETYQCLRVTT